MLELSQLEDFYSLFPDIWNGSAEQDHYGVVHLKSHNGEDLVSMHREDYDQLMQYKHQQEEMLFANDGFKK